MMNLDYYDIFYLFTNIFGTYTIFMYMKIFFDRDTTNKRIEFISYVFYFLFIGFIHISFSNPTINLICNLILFLLLTFNYVATWKARLAAIVCIYAILISIETITIVTLDLINVNNYTYRLDLELILALIISKILSYMVAIIISNFKMLKRNTNISPLHWCTVFFIPLSTLFLTFILMMESNEQNSLQIFLSIAFLFLINILVFYLYDILLKYYEDRIEAEGIKQRAKAYINQLYIINQSQENISIIRHDLKFHIASLHSLIKNNQNFLALEYLNSIVKSIGHVNEYAKSGNAEIDAILNYKIQEAKKRQIEIKLNLQIPNKIDIETIDIVAILGNLLDNAIEATSKIDDHKVIEISIEMERNVLYIYIVNPFAGELLYKDNLFMTTHKDKVSHGFGIKSVKKSIEKYNGEITISHENNMFYVYVLLYNIRKETQL